MKLVRVVVAQSMFIVVTAFLFFLTFENIAFINGNDCVVLVVSSVLHVSCHVCFNGFTFCH